MTSSLRSNTPNKLPASQQRAIKALMQNRKDIRKIGADLRRAYEDRHRLLTRIFTEIENHPERYSHVKRSKAKGGKARTEPMTAALARKLKRKYLADVKLRPLRISGPGCDDFPVCKDVDGCICIFSVGSLCCYACLSPAIIQCDW
jgi:hypothetical protein